jgi:hypothetical protein
VNTVAVVVAFDILASDAVVVVDAAIVVVVPADTDVVVVVPADTPAAVADTPAAVVAAVVDFPRDGPVKTVPTHPPSDGATSAVREPE